MYELRFLDKDGCMAYLRNPNSLKDAIKCIELHHEINPVKYSYFELKDLDTNEIYKKEFKH